MAEQKHFVEQLANFFIGVEVIVVDERHGYTVRDLGEMLLEYNETCVWKPELSYERFDPSRGDPVYHGIASLLGIFGNLMTCTVAHFLTISPLISNFREANVAGDDGIFPEDELDSYTNHVALTLVGEYAREKCFRGDDEAPICLKRPFVESVPLCYLLDNVVPPSLAMTFALLHPERADPRYRFHNLSDKPLTHRLSTVGKDLLRFFSKAYSLDMNPDRLDSIWKGFSRAVNNQTGYKVIADVPLRHSYGQFVLSFGVDPPPDLQLWHIQISDR